MIKNSLRQKQRDWEWRRRDVPCDVAEQFPTNCKLSSIWQCRKYAVMVGMFPDGTAVLSILDRACCHSWRDMQRIKNDVLGEHWAAVEVYPRESQVFDKANVYHLWCTPEPLRIGWDDGGEYTVQHTFYKPNESRGQKALKELLDIPLAGAESQESSVNMFASTT